MKQINNIEYLDPPEEFSSSDLGLSSALISLGYELIKIDKSSILKSLFVFKKSCEIDDAIHRYYNKDLLVDSQTFFDSIRNLKNQLYAN